MDVHLEHIMRRCADGRFAWAHVYVDRLAAESPGEAYPLLLRAAIHAYQGKAEDCRAALAGAGAPGSSRAHAELVAYVNGLLACPGRPPGGIAVAAKNEKNGKDTPAAGPGAAALFEFTPEQMGLLDPDIVAVLRIISQNRYDDARAMVWPMSDADPLDPTPILLTALIDMKQGRSADARDRVVRAETSIRPAHLFRVSQVFAAMEETTRARLYGLRAARAQESEWRVQAWCAVLLTGWPSQAYRAARRAVALAPDQPMAHLVLGAVLQAPSGPPSRARRAETVAALEWVLELAPGNRRARELLARARRTRRQFIARRLGWALVISLVLGAVGALVASLSAGGRGDSGAVETGWFSIKEVVILVVGAVLIIVWLRKAHLRGGVRAAVLRRRTLSRELNTGGVDGVRLLAPLVAATLPLLSSVAAFLRAGSLADGTIAALPLLVLIAALAAAGLGAVGVWWIGAGNVWRCFVAGGALPRVYALIAIVVFGGVNVLAWCGSVSAGGWNLICVGLVCWIFGGSLFALSRAPGLSGT